MKMRRKLYIRQLCHSI